MRAGSMIGMMPASDRPVISDGLYWLAVGIDTPRIFFRTIEMCGSYAAIAAIPATATSPDGSARRGQQHHPARIRSSGHSPR